MPVLVSDTSVLIDLERGSFLEPVFRPSGVGMVAGGAGWHCRARMSKIDHCSATANG